jgi:uroporphyrinogen decarboxylase
MMRLTEANPMAMTSRQRWLCILNRKTPDRIPTDFWSTGEVLDRLLKELNCADESALWENLHVDRPRQFWPQFKSLQHPDDPQSDPWGMRHQTISYGTGDYVETAYCPLASAQSAADVHKFRWPTADDMDFEPTLKAIAEAPDDRIRQGGHYEPFLLYCAMRGMEQAFEDMIVNPEIVDAALDHIFEFWYEHNRRLWEGGGGKIDLMYLAEDLGGQHGPLFSLEAYRRFLLPHQIRMADLARKYNVHIIYHTDGAARVFLPDLIDKVGVEILNPIQWRCPGMERESLVREFGGRVAFHGSIDNQQTLPYGSVQDVIDEVTDAVRIFKGSRWICAPCHNIQPVTPTANIVAMYETIHELGRLT